MATQPHTSSRRSFLAAAALAPVVIAAPAIAAPAPDYMQRLYELDLWTAQLENSDVPDEEWNRWEVESSRLWKEIAALPATPETAKIKARCIHSICNGRLEDVIHGHSTSERLARQVLTILGAAT
ncbi:hypothetical protein K7W03_22680 [Sphingobium sp. PNB]|uniref:hypothetical protein n=1 Tax=Sphingobium sp. PNB TaxID=863934 RepID=UPI001CA3D9FA|nr:hypothetical protein [Sphingobium sp. PNB]MCB4862400.1 hypothetical protein [Sphingobium sp. PNB]